MTKYAPSFLPPSTEMVNDNPKSNRAWMKMMRDAGWERQKGSPGRGWRHPSTGSTFEDHNMVVMGDAQVVLWRSFMATKETPKP